MEWKDNGRYQNWLIWVVQPQNGGWAASVAALPEGGAGFTAGPGEQCVPGEFDSEVDAVAAAKKYIEERIRRRRRKQ
jgi:hypothetical protein